MNPKVDDHINNTKIWQQELKSLRSIILDCGLTETYKWRQPCYTYKNSNILILSTLKKYCVLSFLKGSLLEDKEQILHQPGKDSKAVRYFAFTSVNEILENTATIKAYIFEAIGIEEAGLKVNFESNKTIIIPEELELKFKEYPDLKTAFFKLTTGRQRGYILHFTGSKNPKTRANRIEKYMPRILNKKGIHDCVCGLSKKYPKCDGSHKHKV